MKKILLLILPLCLTVPVLGQWHGNPAINNALSNSTVLTEAEPVSVTDGNSGSIVIMQDINTTDLYAQRITNEGIIAWGDSVNPVLIRSGATNHVKHSAIADGAGGAYIAWLDFEDDPILAEVYMQHIDANGIKLWPVSGLRITNTSNRDETDLYMCSDGVSGVIIAYNWDNYLNNTSIAAQRISPSGNMLWAANGINIGSSNGFRWGSDIISDKKNGAILLFTDTRNNTNGNDYYYLFQSPTPNPLTNLDLYAQRIDSSGNLLWGINDAPVCTETDNQNTIKAGMITDSIGGAIFAFNDKRNDPTINGSFDIFAQKLNASGAPMWTLNGVPVIVNPGNEYINAAISDGNRGLVASWQDQNNFRIYAQRIDAGGNALWGITGLPLTPLSDVANNPKLILDSSLNYVCVFESYNSISVLKAQKISSAGNLLWNSNGVPVCINPNATPASPKIVLSANSTLIVSWEDFRHANTGTPDIYTSKVTANGTLASSGSEYITIANGNWNNPSIWNKNSVPPADANVIVKHNVQANISTTIQTLKIELPNGKLTVLTGKVFTVTN